MNLYFIKISFKNSNFCNQIISFVNTKQSRDLYHFGKGITLISFGWQLTYKISLKVLQQVLTYLEGDTMFIKKTM
jgi:hypothetical protein